MGLRTLVLRQRRGVRRVLMMGVDVAACLAAIWVSFSLRLETWHVPVGSQWVPYLFAPVLCVAVFYRVGVYHTIFRHSGINSLKQIARGLGIFSLLFAVSLQGMSMAGWFTAVPRTMSLIVPFVLLGLMVLTRGGLSLVLQNKLGMKTKAELRSVIIYGAGSAGVQLARAMSLASEFHVVGFVDDKPDLQGNSIDGLPVKSPSSLAAWVQTQEVDDVVLAIPTLTRARRAALLEELERLPVHVRTLPSLSDLAMGRIALSDLRDVEIEDLLGRDAVQPDPVLLKKNIEGKVVLVTGAGGSIGSELCRQVFNAGARALLLVENSEFALYRIHQELQQKAHTAGSSMELVPLLASVTDPVRMRDILTCWRPATVYHAAAYKHVPLVEHNPIQGVANNVLGTWNTAWLARECRVENFVLISTDKAVRPTNIMGASKRLAEMVLQAMAHRYVGEGTLFTMVRFGNVLGSSGSVVPLFREQIRKGGPITLTHPDVTRFFMTIPEASQLVIQASAMGHSGDVFVLDMGEPVRIYDLALKMIELSGLTHRSDANPMGDIDIQITGLRPGEKLYEELLIGEDPQPTSHPRIMKAREDFLPWETLEQVLQQVTHAVATQDVSALRGLMIQTVSGYQAEPSIVDWVYMQQAKTGG